MKDMDKNRDPEKARKRAKGDLRCAARKLGIDAAIKLLQELKAEKGS